MTVIEARLLDIVSYGFQIGPQFQTRIKTLRNGHERRNRNWDVFKWRGSAPYARIRPEHHQDLLGAFLATGGPATAFRFKNWADYKVTGQSLGVAPAGTVAVQLARDYAQFGGLVHTRTITKPVADTVTVYEAGVGKAGTIDTTTGLFTPTEAWVEGAALTADFEYDIPMRFVSDWMPFTIADWRAYEGSIDLIEVLGE